MPAPEGQTTCGHSSCGIERRMVKLRSRLRGAHRHVSVFMGPDADHLALTGELVMGPADWMIFAAGFAMGARRFTPLTVVFEDDDSR